MGPPALVTRVDSSIALLSGPCVLGLGVKAVFAWFREWLCLQLKLGMRVVMITRPRTQDHHPKYSVDSYFLSLAQLAHFIAATAAHAHRSCSHNTWNFQVE